MNERTPGRVTETILRGARRRRMRVHAFFKRFAARRLSLAGLAFLAVIAVLALGADLFASATPLAYSINGELRILPGRLGRDAFPGRGSAASLAEVDAKGEWILLPPVPYDPNQAKVLGHMERLAPPSSRHFLGTDDKGRDVLARMIHGARSALLVALGSVGLYLLAAVLLGAIAGYFGGLADRIVLRIIETLTSFPTFFLILAIQGLLGATSLAQIILLIGLTRWVEVAQLTRGEVLRIANEDYVFAARALGLGHIAVLARHVLPAAMGTAVVAATFGAAGSILIESTLSFLGFGLPESTASWGQLLTDAFYNEGAYWLSLFPGLLLFFTILSINLVGEGLREALDPAG